MQEKDKVAGEEERERRRAAIAVSIDNGAWAAFLIFLLPTFRRRLQIVLTFALIPALAQAICTSTLFMCSLSHYSVRILLYFKNVICRAMYKALETRRALRIHHKLQENAIIFHLWIFATFFLAPKLIGKLFAQRLFPSFHSFSPSTSLPACTVVIAAYF